jgi:hypothetical protein
MDKSRILLYPGTYVITKVHPGSREIAERKGLNSWWKLRNQLSIQVHVLESQNMPMKFSQKYLVGMGDI